jgi:DNA-binding transcriptional LysR family regulator
MRASVSELNIFMAVAAHLSFRKAAVELDMTPSAISHTMRVLEGKLGVRLINRTTRSVALSGAGESLLARLRPVMRELSDALDEVDAMRDNPSGILRINASEGAARTLLSPYIAKFLCQYPDMSVDLFADGRMVDIVEEGFDLGVRLREAVPQDMVAVPFGQRMGFSVVASPDYFAQRTVPKVPADLLAHNCIRYRMPSGKLLRWEFERHGQQIVLDVKGRLSLNEPRLMVQAALDGVGVAYAFKQDVGDYIAKGRLIPCLEDWLQDFDGMCLYYPGRRNLSAGMRVFVDLVKHAATQQ